MILCDTITRRVPLERYCQVHSCNMLGPSLPPGLSSGVWGYAAFGVEFPQPSTMNRAHSNISECAEPSCRGLTGEAGAQSRHQEGEEEEELVRAGCMEHW